MNRQFGNSIDKLTNVSYPKNRLYFWRFLELNEENNIFLTIEGDPISNENKNKIVKYSIDLFSEKGYSSVSVRDITKFVGIKESSLYNHFRSKEEILETIFYNFQQEVAKIMPPIQKIDYLVNTLKIKGFLEAGFANFLEHITKATNEKIWRIVLLERGRNPFARTIFLNDIVGLAVNILEIAFSAWIDKEGVMDIDPHLLATEFHYTFITIIEIYLLLKIDQEDTSSIETQMRQYLEFFTNNLKRFEKRDEE